MKNIGIALLSILLVALFLNPVVAHDQKLHKGKPVEGVVTKVTADGFEMKSGESKYVVKVDEHTKFELGEELVSQDKLSEGTNVKVFGTKLPGGKIVAKEVLINATPQANKVSETEHLQEIEK